jgi:bacillolysin
MRLNQLVLNTAFLILFIIITFPTNVHGENISGDSMQKRALVLKDLLDSTIGTNKESPQVFKTKDGHLRFIGAAPSTHLAVEPSKRGTPEQAAGAFLERWQYLFVSDSAAVGFDVKRVRNRNSRSYVRYRQTYAGLEVFGAEVIIQVNSTGGVVAAISDIMRNAEGLDNGNVSLVPDITSSSAQNIAIEYLTTRYKELQFVTSMPTLMIFASEIFGSNGNVCLIWRVDVENIGGLAVKERILVDAHTGKIVFRYPLVFHMTRDIYDAENTSTGWGDPPTRHEDDPPVGLPDVDLAYDYLGHTYDFYYDYHGRDSYNGNGAVLEARVRYDAEEDARWMNTFMRIGPNYSVDEVIAHEFTHGVTQYESELIYSNESGAINESFSDMWGEWVDLTNGAGNDTPDVKWKIGEDTWGPIYGQGPFRSMKDPPELSTTYGGPMPDRYGSSNYYHGSEDNGGVHHNSGVGNKLCYLLTDGDSFNGHTVYGMEIEKTADLCSTNVR